MKKYIILSLIATFVSIFSANAQDNTYSVVIQMAGGTTFTIGPNEVENITFKDGEVLVSGTSIQSIMDYIKLNSALIAENQERAMENTMRIAADEAAIAELVTRAEAYYKDNLTQLTMLSEQINNCASRADLAELMARVNAMEEVLAYTKTDIDVSYFNNKTDSLSNVTRMIEEGYAQKEWVIDYVLQKLSEIPGSGSVDLSNYVTKDQMDLVLQYVQALLTEKYQEMLQNDQLLKDQVAYLNNEVIKNTEEIAMLREMIEQLRKEVTELSGK